MTTNKNVIAQYHVSVEVSIEGTTKSVWAIRIENNLIVERRWRRIKMPDDETIDFFTGRKILMESLTEKRS